MTQASQSMSCDSECQRKKTEAELKQKYLNAQTNLATAPDQVSSSLKNSSYWDQTSLLSRSDRANGIRSISPKSCPGLLLSDNYGSLLSTILLGF